MRTWNNRLAAILACLATAALLFIGPAQAQPQSRLYEVTKNKKLRVCQFPLYYSISFRNPTTGQIEGSSRSSNPVSPPSSPTCRPTNARSACSVSAPP
jgi:hypothetical protein